VVFRVLPDDRRDRLGEPIAPFEVSHLIDEPFSGQSCLFFLSRGKCFHDLLGGRVFLDRTLSENVVSVISAS